MKKLILIIITMITFLSCDNTVESIQKDSKSYMATSKYELVNKIGD